jgi:bacterioferritin-associated ferredoxin
VSEIVYVCMCVMISEESLREIVSEGIAIEQRERERECVCMFVRE